MIPWLGQLQAGFQAVFHEELDAVVLEVVDLGVGVARGQDPDGGRRHRRQVTVQPVFDGPPPVPGGDEEQRRFLGQAGEDRHRVGKGFHRQFMGAVDEFPDQGVDDPGREVQAVFQKEGGDVLVAEVVPLVIAFPGQGQKGGHDVGHHPVDVEGQLDLPGDSAGKGWGSKGLGLMGNAWY